ncbi:MAG: hypothetical protein M3389_04220 [Actinomycetota bacterium]|nr:hypothetical protein [Actinomycetota bacterium]
MKLRLVKVAVQPHFVLDDGETLREVVTDPVVISAAEWQAYRETGFDEAVAELERRLSEEQGS